MKKTILKNTLSILVVISMLFAFFSIAEAGSLTLTLHQNSLNNVDDSAGRWQYEGGKVYIISTGNNISGINYIADYAITRRVITGGTDAQNVAMMTMTIFLIGNHPPQNLTLQGSHDYSNGNNIGSISAASSGLISLVGSTFSIDGSANTLTITY